MGGRPAPARTRGGVGGRAVRLHQLEVFALVCEQGSVSAAARLLRLSQPAVSMQVRELERDLGVALFSRSGRRMTPTEAGRALHGYAAQIRGTVAEAEAAMAEHRAGQRGAIRIGASATGVVYYLPALLHGFRASHPQVDLRVEADLTERIREGVLHGRIDVGLIWGPSHDERLREEPLLTASFVPIFPPQHRLLQQPAVRVADLRAEPFVLPGDDSSPTLRYIVGCLREAGCDPHVVMGLRSTEEVKQAVAAGLGIGVVAARAVRFELGARALATRPVDGLTLPPRSIVLVLRRASGPGSAATAALVEHVRHAAAAEAGGNGAGRDDGAGPPSGPSA